MLYAFNLELVLVVAGFQIAAAWRISFAHATVHSFTVTTFYTSSASLTYMLPTNISKLTARQWKMLFCAWQAGNPSFGLKLPKWLLAVDSDVMSSCVQPLGPASEALLLPVSASAGREQAHWRRRRAKHASSPQRSCQERDKGVI